MFNFKAIFRGVKIKRGAPCRTKLRLEQLEDRITPSTFPVTDLSDNPADTGSIRYAIAAVNADASSATDTIDLTGVSGTIVLSNSTLAMTRTAGQVVITGPGASALTINGNSASQVLNFVAGMNVSLSGLTI